LGDPLVVSVRTGEDAKQIDAVARAAETGSDVAAEEDGGLS
jgi:hypothetical protein